MPTYSKYTLSSGGVPIYASTAGFPTAPAGGTLAVDSSTNILYEYNATAVAWQPIASNAAYNAAIAGGVTTVGAINGQPKSANAAVILGNSIYMQTADATFPGAVSVGTQTFAGDKTLTGSTALAQTSVSGPASAILIINSSSANGVATSWYNNGTLLGQIGSAKSVLGNSNLGEFSVVAQHGLSLGVNAVGAVSEAIYIDPNGNVGFGTVVPSTTIDAIGPIWSTRYGGPGEHIAQQANGSLATPTATLSGDQIANFGARGYGTTAFAGTSSASMRMLASENFTDAAKGTAINWYTAPNGTTVGLARATLTNDGTFDFTTAAAASVPGARVSGTWFSSGSSTTTKPKFLVEPTGTTSNNWSTGGTGLGVNAPNAFAGILIGLQVNGSDRFYVDASGNSVSAGTSTATQLTSTVATGTAPFVVASTTQVANLNAATAGSATNTAITDDTTTNATVYPTWVTATTGNLPQKVSSTKLTFNPSTGALIAAGPITGSNLSGTNTGDVALGTANGLSLVGQTLSLALSSTSTTGALSSTDWNAFNGKQAAGSYITSLTGGVTASGPGAASATVVTNANLTGPITSAGNATAVASQTGTGTTFVMNTSPILVTPVIGAASGTSLSLSGQFTSTLATGTAPFVIASTTRVSNLNVATAGNADTVTTNANLTGVITSVGNATSIASQTGTGSVFVVQNTPTLTTPVIGAATGTSLSVTGQLTSTLATGTAPLVVSSTTRVSNLNVATAGNADTVTTNANLTGPITSTGNATAIASQTGTGATFVMSASPTLTGTLTAATANFSGQVTSTFAGQGLVTSASQSASSQSIRVENTNSTAGSNAQLFLKNDSGTSHGFRIQQFATGGTGGQNLTSGLTGEIAQLFTDYSGGMTIGTNNIAAMNISTAQVISVIQPLTVSGGITGSDGTGNAATGIVGEYVSSSVSTPTSVPGATTAWGDMTSISLTAGDWDITGVAYWYNNGSTITAGSLSLGISTTSGNSSTGLVDGDNKVAVPQPSAGIDRAGDIPCWRLRISATTTVYLKTQLTYIVATPQFQCRFSARRIR